MESQRTVLLVDDDPAVSKVLSAVLGQEGIRTAEVRSGGEALEWLERRPADVVLTDLRMPGIDGMQLLARIGSRWPEVPVIMLTAHGTVPLAVEAMKRGAAEFLQKPFERDEVVFVVKRALASASALSQRAPRVESGNAGILGDSVAMREAMALVDRAASGGSTVLVRGESGTGKELVARALHEKSPRRAKPFVAVHCAALPENLLESELFGYERGAFTGAMSRKPGRVELAHEGTLFFDEIGDVPLSMQVKLLRVLQERAFERVGGTETIKVDVRFVAATHRNLEAMVESGAFREDLFYRLSVVPLFIPPLRARPDDVGVLARHFAALHAKSQARTFELAEPAIERLAREPWPGNVRQLQNFVERLVVFSDGPVIDVGDVERELAREGTLARPARAGESGREEANLDLRRREAEKDAIKTALKRAGDNRTLAARLLGVSRRTLYNKLEEYGIS
jgi:two-component system, NtrC family, response regulator AtoC